MFKQPTVFIVGAGASAEFNMPVGAQLKEQIRKGVDFERDIGDPELAKILKNNFANTSPYKVGGTELSQTISMFQSIDEALHWWRKHKHVIELGKIAIAHYILAAERSSTLNAGATAVKNNDKTWLTTFLSIALSGLDQSEVLSAFQNVTIINFNYDRTIEHYLYWALQELSAVGAGLAAVAVKKLEIIRPYGSLGKLDWQEEAGGNPFGGTNVIEASNNIGTFTQQITDLGIQNAIEAALLEAHMVIFLGFGFHQQNMELLKPKHTPGTPAPALRQARVVLATAMGMASENHTAITSYFDQELKLRSPMLLNHRAEYLMVALRPTITLAAV